jgi:polyphenol oxidase
MVPSSFVAGQVTSADAGRRAVAALEERIDPAAGVALEALLVEGLPLLRMHLPGAFRAVFTTRHGGVSSGAFASLNLGDRSQDDQALVTVNRRRLAVALGWLGDEERRGRPGSAPGLPVAGSLRLISPAQVHGTHVAGAAEYLAADDFGLACDGLTLHPVLDRGLAAVLQFADCVPVVLVGEVDIAVAHAGWRGLLGGVIQQAGRAMTGPPALAFIGPSIGPCCYTVDARLAGMFADRYGDDVVVQDRVGHPSFGTKAAQNAAGSPRVDLWAAAAAALSELCINADRIVNPRLCTSCNNDLFYSYRREGPVCGRHGAAAWIAPQEGPEPSWQRSGPAEADAISGAHAGGQTSAGGPRSAPR